MPSQSRHAFSVLSATSYSSRRTAVLTMRCILHGNWNTQLNCQNFLGSIRTLFLTANSPTFRCKQHLVNRSMTPSNEVGGTFLPETAIQELWEHLALLSVIICHVPYLDAVTQDSVQGRGRTPALLPVRWERASRCVEPLEYALARGPPCGVQALVPYCSQVLRDIKTVGCIIILEGALFIRYSCG